MQSKNVHPRVLSVMSWILATIFLLAAVSKLVALPEIAWSGYGLKWEFPNGHWLLPSQNFATAIQNYGILPPFFCRLLAVTLPWIEIAAAVALLTRRFRYEGALIIGGLLVAFFIAIARALIIGLDISCGCFLMTFKERHIGWQNLLFDGILIVLTGTVIALMEKERKKH